MNNLFQQKYIKTWASIANSYSPVLLKSRYASSILAYLGIKQGQARRCNAVVELVKEFLP